MTRLNIPKDLISSMAVEGMRSLSTKAMHQHNATAWSVQKFSDWAEQDFERTAWLIPQFIPQEGIVVLSGFPKIARKTLTADIIAVCLAAGKSMSMLTVPEPISVLYVEEEGGAAETKNAIQAVQRAVGASANMDIYMAFHDRVKLDSKEWIAKIIEVVKAKQIKLVIFDALTYLHDGDENSTSEMLVVARGIQDIRAAGTAVLVLVHLDKSRGSDTNADIDLQMRGSSIISNLYDVHLALRKPSTSQKDIDLIVRGRHLCEKQYKVAWNLVPLKNDLNLLDKMSLIVTPHSDDVVHDDAILDGYIALMEPTKKYQYKELRELWEVSTKKASSILKILINEETIVKVGARTYTLGGESQ